MEPSFGGAVDQKKGANIGPHLSCPPNKILNVIVSTTYPVLSPILRRDEIRPVRQYQKKFHKSASNR